MANLSQVMGEKFDANTVEIQSYEPIPEGEYVAVIASVDLKSTKTGGEMLVFDFTITGSQHDGRILTERLNIVNANERAVNIAKQQLAKICLALNMPTPEDTDDFIGKKLKLSVGVKPGEGTYIDKYGQEKPSLPQNIVRGYSPVNAMTQTQTEQAPQENELQTEAPQTAARRWSNQ